MKPNGEKIIETKIIPKPFNPGCSRKKIRKRGSNRERKLRLPRRMRQNDRRRNYILIDS